MRIIGEIPHPFLKITLFKNAERYSAKFEGNLLEQTYKFRASETLDSYEDMLSLITPEFIEGVLQNFTTMNKQRLASLRNLEKEEEFEVII